MVTLALMIWLAVAHHIVAPWWLWTMWVVFWLLNIILEVIKLAVSK